MSVTKFEFEEKKHILQIDGVDYVIPQRTEKIECKLREHDKRLDNMSELEANFNTLEILFGNDAANKMFPEKDAINLDKLAKCVKYALALYRAEQTAIREEEIKEKLDAVQPLLKSVGDISKLANKAEMKKFVSHKKK